MNRIEYAKKAEELNALHEERPQYQAPEGKTIALLSEIIGKDEFMEIKKKYIRKHRNMADEYLYSRYMNDITEYYDEIINEDMETAARYDQVVIFKTNDLYYFDQVIPHSLAEAFNLALERLHVQFIMAVLKEWDTLGMIEWVWKKYYANDWTRKVFEASRKVWNNPINRTSWRNFLKALTKRLNNE